MLMEKLFPQRRNTSGVTNPSSWFVDWITQGRAALSGVAVNLESSLTISAVYRGVNLIAGDVAKVPCYLYRRQGAGKVLADNHPAYSLVRRKPNPWVKAYDFKKLLTAHAILKGNGYAWIDTFEGRRILRNLDPSATMPYQIVGGEVMYLTQIGGRMYDIPGTQMLHIRNVTLDGLCGLGVVDKAREALGLSIAAERYGAAFFGNSARPNVAITYPATMTPEKKTALREAWERAYKGVDNSNKVAILEGGLDLKTFGATNEEAQFLATREFSIRDVANWIGVPPHMLGDTTRTAYASIEQENKSYLQTSLDYWLTAWEEELWEKLLTPEEKAADELLFEFLRKRLISMDAKTEAEVLAIELNNGVLTLDEVRAMDNRQPAPGGRGDTYRMPLNIGIIGEDGVPVAPVKQEPDKPEGEAEPEPDGADKDDDARARAAAVLEDAVRRCIRRVAHTARSASRKPGRFLEWLDKLTEEHTHAAREALTMPLWAATGCDRAEAGKRAAAATEALLARVAAELLEVSGQATAEKLPEAVAERMAAVEFGAADLAQGML